MSRGLGHSQRRALEVLSAHPRGLTVPQLSALLNVEPRRGRALVASLAARQLVEFDSGPGSYRIVRLPAALLEERRLVEFDREATNGLTLQRVRRAAREGRAEDANLVCPACGTHFQVSAPRDLSKFRAAVP